MKKILIAFCLFVFVLAGASQAMQYYLFVVEGSEDPTYYFGRAILTDVMPLWDAEIASGAAIPVADATVTITNISPESLLSSSTTGSNGRIWPFSADQPVRLRIEKRGYRTKTLDLYFPAAGEAHQMLEVKIPIQKLRTTDLTVIERVEMPAGRGFPTTTISPYYHKSERGDFQDLDLVDPVDRIEPFTGTTSSPQLQPKTEMGPTTTTTRMKFDYRRFR